MVRRFKLANDIPKVEWRFGEDYLATDFVMAKNTAIMGVAALLSKENNDQFVEAVASWIRDSFFYPLDNGGNPSASGQLLRHHKGIFLVGGYHFKKCVYYVWSLPNEVLQVTKCGICIDTANLAASVLRAKLVADSWVCLGSVKSIDGTLLGRHAWVSTLLNGKAVVMETTVHTPGANNLIEATKVYDKTSDWAREHDLYYELEARFNEKEYVGEGPLAGEIVGLMGLPAKRVLIFGIEHTRQQKPRRLYKEWRQEELFKTRLLREAYGR